MRVRRAVPWIALALVSGCADADRLRVQAQKLAVAPSVSITASFARSVGSRGSAVGEFIRPAGISVNTMGRVFVVDAGNDRVQQFDDTGRYISEIGGFGWSDRQFNQPLGISASASLDIWVADTQNRRIVHLDGVLHWLGALDTDASEEGSAQELGYPTDVVESDDGWLWFTDRDTDRLRRLSPYDELIGFTTTAGGSGELSNPMGVAICPDGRIVVADTGNDRLVYYDQFGTVLRTWGEGYLKRPCGVEVTKQGDIIVADTGNHRIVFVNRLGNRVGVLGEQGRGPAMFESPHDVAVDRRNRLWVSDTGNNRLQVFTLDRRVD